MRYIKKAILGILLVSLLTFLIFSIYIDQKNKRYISNLENYPGGYVAVSSSSDYIEYCDGYTLGMDKIFGLFNNLTRVWIEQSNENMTVRLVVQESIAGEFRYSIEYKDLPVKEYVSQDKEYYRNEYLHRGKFDLSLDNQILSKCGDQFLNDEQLKKYSEIYSQNYETIINLERLANEYWEINFK
jgi:uncharacterized membrane protein